MVGARWDDSAGQVSDSRPRELSAAMPVTNLTAAVVQPTWSASYPRCSLGVGYARHQADLLECPVYVTQPRGALRPSGGKVKHKNHHRSAQSTVAR